jgi:hypothetical protein
MMTDKSSETKKDPAMIHGVLGSGAGRASSAIMAFSTPPGNGGVGAIEIERKCPIFQMVVIIHKFETNMN